MKFVFSSYDRKSTTKSKEYTTIAHHSFREKEEYNRDEQCIQDGEDNEHPPTYVRDCGWCDLNNYKGTDPVGKARSRASARANACS